MNRSLRFCCFAVFYLSVHSAAHRVYGADLTKIYVGYGGIAGYQMPLWVNKEAGIGKKYGADIEPLLDPSRRTEEHSKGNGRAAAQSQ